MGDSSSSWPSDFPEDSVKGYKVRWRKCEETLAKLLNEGKDIGGFAIKGKGKGEIWKRERKVVI